MQDKFELQYLIWVWTKKKDHEVGIQCILTYLSWTFKSKNIMLKIKKKQIINVDSFLNYDKK